MSTMAKDYYKTLGVSRTANDKEIKSAFRKLAKQYHPDANKNDPNAEARFKEINEAYEVLSDKDKRETYDRFGTVNPQEMPNMGNMRGNPFAGGGAQQVDMSDLFESIFGSFRRGSAGSTTGFGQEYRSAGQDLEQGVSISLQEAYSGTTRLVTKGDRTIRVNIPAGAATGTRVRVAGEGEPGMGGGQPGDLYLLIQVEPDEQFERKGDDLTVEVKVDMFTAMLGGEVEVPTLNRPVKLRVPSGTQSGRRFRLSGKGMPVLRHPDKYGDLFARVLITVPDKLSPTQRELVEQLKATF
jgi:curved DNA-binding protein